MDIMFFGKYHHLNAFFDENNNYVESKVVDNRIGSNLIASVLIILVAFGLGCFLSYVILLLLYIPVLVCAIVAYIKKKRLNKKVEKQS